MPRLLKSSRSLEALDLTGNFLLSRSRCVYRCQLNDERNQADYRFIIVNEREIKQLVTWDTIALSVGKLQ